MSPASTKAQRTTSQSSSSPTHANPKLVVWRPVPVSRLRPLRPHPPPLLVPNLATLLPLNGRYLTLASMLPPLPALRRPSKAAIVSSRCVCLLPFLPLLHFRSIRLVVRVWPGTELVLREIDGPRQTCAGADSATVYLRADELEINEWRARARVPQLDAAVRSDAHTAVLRAETEDFELVLEEGLELEEEGAGADDQK
ncbi:hypothetical protein B0H19DRAFT_1272222 [Mycena capillaripes]|nr:hypothetical protein B0H19DRAFT_1272222 [Mycena capillaripes]